MAIENASYLHALDAQYPATGDQIPEGDDHLRMIKAVLKATFPGRNGAASRTIAKGAGFTPLLTEISSIYVVTASVTVTLPLLSGLPDGAYYFVKALGGTATITPASGNTLDCGTLVVPQGGAVLLAKYGTVWATLFIPALTAAAIVAALGSTPVANATTAANGGVTSVGGATGAITVGAGLSISGNQLNCTVTSPVTSVGGNVGAVSNAQLATSMVAGLGYTPANPANAATDHNHNGVYAPMTAFVAAGKIASNPGSSYDHSIRFTRANGSTLDVITYTTGS